MFNSKMFNQGPFNGVPGEKPLAPAVQYLEMLYVFGSDEKLVATLPKGNFFEPKHKEVLNGENTFVFSFPADQYDAQYIVEGNLVGYKDYDVSWHIFEIKRIVDLHGDGLTRTAYCEHIFYELLDDIITDQRPSSTAIAALTNALSGTRWSVGIVDDLGTSNTTIYYENVLAGVQKIAEAWAGELQWRCVITGGVITRYCDLRAARGSDTGKQFAYSKDILEIEREVDLSGVITAVYGRGKGVELDTGSYGRRLTFKDEVWTVAGGDPVNKPADQEWVGDPAALALYGRPGNRHRFGVFTNEEQTDAGALLQESWDYLQNNNSPRITYALKVVALETLSGYSHEAVRLGDLVRVIDREFTPELVVSARVVEITRDLQDPSQTEVVLGSFYPTIVETTINTERRVNDLANRPYNTAWLDGKISVLQNEIENTTSFVYQTEDDGILIMDAATFASATKAMKLGGGVFAIANSKTGSNWNWRTFGTGAGFTADEMNTGTLNAALVKILSAGGDLIIDGSGLMMYDDNDDLRVQIGSWMKGLIRKYGIKIIDGEIYSSLIRSGAEDATEYIQFVPPNRLQVWYNNKLQFDMGAVFGGTLDFYHSADAPSALDMVARISGSYSGADMGIMGNDTGKIVIGDNLYVTGNISKGGTYSALEPTLNYGDRLLYAAECPELKYYDSGVINLQNGEATVHLDPIFLECIEPDTELTPWQIWVQCYGENDVYVAEVGTDYFVIKERNGGTSNNKVIWRFEAIRKNYAGIRLMEVTN